MPKTISFVLDGEKRAVDCADPRGPRPTTTVLQYLRNLPTHKGAKEGCAEGDCGACTVALGELDADGRIRYRAVDSCLVFLPMIHGKHLVTVENLRNGEGALHPVQQAIVETGGSQCGYCTPASSCRSLRSIRMSTAQPALASTPRWRGTCAAAPATNRLWKRQRSRVCTEEKIISPTSNLKPHRFSAPSRMLMVFGSQQIRNLATLPAVRGTPTTDRRRRGLRGGNSSFNERVNALQTTRTQNRRDG